MTESARNAARMAVIENVLGSEDVDSVESSIVGMREAEEAVIHRIGALYVDSDESAASNLRDNLYRAQTVREVAERFLAEARDIMGAK